MPKDSFATYSKIVCDKKAFKTEIHRTLLTVGGDKIEYPFDVSSSTVDITTFKCLINSVLSTRGARIMGIDIHNFYLNTLLECHEYMKLLLDIITEEIIVQYNLCNLVHTNGYVYIEIMTGIYGLPQAGRLANNQFKAHLIKYGYQHSTITNGLWTHKTRDTVFTLVVNNFGVKYSSQQDADHLMNALKDLYRVTLDWEGRQFIGITLDWNYERRWCEISMPGYVQKALIRFLATNYKKYTHTV